MEKIREEVLQKEGDQAGQDQERRSLINTTDTVEIKKEIEIGIERESTREQAIHEERVKRVLQMKKRRKMK